MLTPQQLELVSDEYYVKGFVHVRNRLYASHLSSEASSTACEQTPVEVPLQGPAPQPRLAVNAQRVRENLKVAHFQIMGQIGRLSSNCDGFRVCDSRAIS